MTPLIPLILLIGLRATPSSPSPDLTRKELSNGNCEPVAIRSKTIELEYRLNETGSRTNVELWYTRDRGLKWELGGTDPDGLSPIQFTAPAEGLYGLLLRIPDDTKPHTGPKSGESAQRWIFIDYHPPLAQWLNVSPSDDFAAQRILHLLWTAHDDHLLARPIGLDYQCEPEKIWRKIERDLPNDGRFDWAVPAGIDGPLYLRLTVYDRGGNITERTHGPIALPKAVGLPDTRPSPVTTRPSESRPPEKTMTRNWASTQPVSSADAERARQLYKQGAWYLARGEHALAAGRLQEALQHNPAMIKALYDLGQISDIRNDHAGAIDLYSQALLVDPHYQPAIRGSALAYIAQGQYAKSRDMFQRLLATNDRDAEALLDMGDVLLMMGDRISARQQWSRVLEADPSAQAMINKARQRLEIYNESSRTDKETWQENPQARRKP